MLLVIAGNTLQLALAWIADERLSAQAPAVLPRAGGRPARCAQEMGHGARR
jgi:hypothetical protein